MSSEIKASAIPLAGYVYQTLHGVNLLCDWLDAPTRYDRVRFECDDEAVAPQGLDDVVAERRDGRVDVTQVKFTPSPENHALDWNWLLTKPGKAGGTSRSLLRKWFDAFAAIDPKRIGEVCLITNRAPDLAMETCLAGGAFIDYKKAPADVQTKIEADLSGEANAQRLFHVLRVFHSDKGYSSLEHHVTSRLRKHSTIEGIETLKNRAVQWAIQKKLPAPEGWITFDVLQSTLRIIAPEPLPEDFVIPDGYKIPDAGFHAQFLDQIRSISNRPIVLTGPPGRGKSTYLSRVCETLGKLGIPFIRHHYYLSATDRTADRYTSYAVEEALLAQIRKFHTGVGAPDGGLARALAECATKYKADGKPFVVIIDGLDHVWRTQGFPPNAIGEAHSLPIDRLASAIVRTADTLCPSNEADWYRQSPLATLITKTAIEKCKTLNFNHRGMACQALLEASVPELKSKLPNCLGWESRRKQSNPPPHYGIYDFSATQIIDRWHPCDPRKGDLLEKELEFGETFGGLMFPQTRPAYATPDRILAGCHIPKSYRTQGESNALPQQEDYFLILLIRVLLDNDFLKFVLGIEGHNAPLKAPTQQQTSQPHLGTGNPGGPACGKWLAQQKPAVTENACSGVKVYVQTYGVSQNAALACYQGEWQSRLGAAKLPIEDVRDSARRRGRPDPLSIAETTVRFHDSDSFTCAQALGKAVGQTWRVEPLSPRLKTQRATVEVWIAEKDSLTANQSNP